MTRFLVRLVEGSPSFVATELPFLPALQFVNSLMRMPYVAGSVNTDMDSESWSPQCDQKLDQKVTVPVSDALPGC